jgi:hypothetical protein
MDDSSSSAGASGAPARSVGAWTSWKDVDKSKYKSEGGSGRKEGKRPWTAQAYREATSECSEQDRPARKWEEYPSGGHEPKYTQEDKKGDPPWREWTRYSTWAQAAWSTHESGAKSDYGSGWKSEGWSDRGSWPMTPSAKRRPGKSVVADAAAETMV